MKQVKKLFELKPESWQYDQPPVRLTRRQLARMSRPYRETVSAMYLIPTICTVVLMTLWLLFYRDDMTWLLAIIIGLALVMAVVVRHIGNVARDYRQRMETVRFAAANQLTPVAERRAFRQPGMLFAPQLLSEITDGYRFGPNDMFELATVKYTVYQKQHRRSYLRIRQARRLPHVVLAGKALGAESVVRSLPTSFKRSQTFQLEGDFPKYFDVYAPQHYEADALYILTPDVMAALIDYGAGLDIEIVDNDVYLYLPVAVDLTQQPVVEALQRLCTAVGREIYHQTDYYADHRVDDRSIDDVTSQGRRLQVGIGLVALAGFVLYVAQFFWRGARNVSQITTSNGHAVNSVEVGLVFGGLLVLVAVASLLWRRWYINRW